MLRTTIYLEEGTALILRQLAKTHGRPQSELIREAIDSFVHKQDAEKRTLPLGVGLYRSGRSDVSTNTEKLLRKKSKFSKMTLIADSGALYALYDRDDKHHVAVVNVIKKERGAIVVPATILVEVDYLLREFLGIDAELDFLNAIISGAYALEHLTSTDLERARDLIATYRDLDLGLADAAVVATAERLKIRRILTVDERDFRAVKPQGANFVILPSDQTHN